jgi:hypothetical protein
MEGQKWKGTPNKRSATKPTQNQSNTMEARFTWLDILVTNKGTQVKFNAYGLKKTKDQKNI